MHLAACCVMSRAMFGGIAVLLFCAGAAAQLAPLPPPGVQLVHIVSLPMRASALIGMEVRSADGSRAGTIADLVFDLEGNRVQHAVIALPERRVAVTLFELRLSLERTYLMLPADRARIQPAPPIAADPAASELLKRNVYDTNGTRRGELIDALIDAHEGEVPFALLRTDGELYPLPLDALQLEADRLVLRVDAARLQPGQSFSAQALQANLHDSNFLRRHAAYADRLTVGRRRDTAHELLGR